MASDRNARHNSAMSYSIQAENFATTSENKIHSDEFAKKFGFQGALVPGVTVYGYLTTPLLQRFGSAWLAHSVADLRLLKPTYDSERVRVELQDDESGARASAYNKDGELLATLASYMPDALPDLEYLHLLDGDIKHPDRVEIRWDNVVESQAFAPWTITLDADENRTYTTQAKDELALYADIVHPHWLLSLANTALMNEYVMPTWIHVGSTTHHRDLLKVGDTVTVRCATLQKWRKKGHEFIKIYITLWRDGDMTTDILHTAIFKVST
jgi:acyl dehydratase